MEQQTLAQLRREFAEQREQADAILRAADDEGRPLTAEEHDACTAAIARSEELRTQIEQRQTDEVRERARSLRELPAAEPRTRPMPRDGGEFREAIRERRSLGLRFFRGPDGPILAETLARSALAAAMPHNQRRHLEWMERRGVLETRAPSPAMVEGTEGDGGFIVPSISYSNDWINNQGVYGAVSGLYRRFQVPTVTHKVPKRSAIPEFAAVNENTDLTPQKGTGVFVDIEPKKWGALVPFSSELDEDSLPYVGDVLAEMLAEGAAKREDNVAMNADGTAPYHSMTGVIPGTLAAGQLSMGTGDTEAADVTLPDLWGLIAKVKPEALGPGCAWVMNPLVWSAYVVPSLLGLGGAMVEDALGAPRPSLGGYPVVTTQALPATPAVNTPFIVFGNFLKGGAWGERRGLTLKRSEHFYFGSDTLALLATIRFGVKHHDLAAAGAGAVGMFAVLKTAAA